ncbi:hypothetical protein ON010_g14976 [Phytophthora cinnamomi]|nr:hypothetical protein ON010_g14976 [Phytophthora cinnamomi]
MEKGSMDATSSALPKLRPLLTDSILTDQDRRQVRYMERELLDNMKDQADELTKLTSKTFDAAAGDLDEIYKHVCYPREGNLDGLCLKELESAVEKQSKMLSGTDLTKTGVAGKRWDARLGRASSRSQTPMFCEKKSKTLAMLELDL